jgi:hypothetical protein
MIYGILKQVLETHWNKQTLGAQRKCGQTRYGWRIYE